MNEKSWIVNRDQLTEHIYSTAEKDLNLKLIELKTCRHLRVRIENFILQQKQSPQLRNTS